MGSDIGRSLDREVDVIDTKLLVEPVDLIVDLGFRKVATLLEDFLDWNSELAKFYASAFEYA